MLTRFRFLALCWLAACGFASLASSGGLLSKAEAQEVAGQRLPTILKLMAEPRTPSRDSALYAAALALFKSVEDGNEPVQSREPLAKALYEVALGGHADAWAAYGRCLWNGWGVPENREEALAAYKRAASLGSDYGAYAAAHSLYWSFERYEEAYAYAQQALKGDDPEGEVRYLLGLMAYSGRGRPKDIEESIRLHQEAADRGNGDASFELFTYAMNGITDRSNAIFYLKEAAERDQPRACYNLGAAHATGQLQGIEKDLVESIRWYQRAADLGSGKAAAALGVMALRGEGMARDPQAAKAFLKRAEDLDFDVDGYLKSMHLERPQ